ncbi:MAG: hypothetical protein ABW046_00400 [Actinoplanes sp.]
MVPRLHGFPDGLTDDELRPLRPIGMSVHDAAARTGDLLRRLGDAPGVRLLTGVRVTESAPPIGLAVSTPSHLLLVESVAWPYGVYTTTARGDVLCDGIYIGQSVHPLLGSVRRLRRFSGRRRLGAVVVVHSSAAGIPSLPVSTPGGPAWLPPEKVCARIAGWLRRGHVVTYCQNDTNSW